MQLNDEEWEIVETGDGSLSLRSLQSLKQEIMHHRGGAVAETVYVYAPLIRAALEKIENPHFVVVGLGIGYIELVILREMILSNRTCSVVSFESDPFLRTSWMAFVQNESSPLEGVYHKACEILGPSAEGLRSALQTSYREGLWRLDEAFVDASQVAQGAHGFFWDAFSRATSPELWEENLLKSALGRAHADAGLASYACNAPLKRSLKSEGFTVNVRRGFQGKRNSTLALRGVLDNVGATDLT